jgi:predicted Zn-dependent protease
VAVEPDTAVLALGGPPTFQPSASEWIERARPHLRNDPARARRILDELRAARPDSAGVGIGQALFAVAQGNIALAREELAAVLAEEPNLRIALAQDPDLGPLLEDPS